MHPTSQYPETYQVACAAVLLFAVMTALCILIAIQLEERDQIVNPGDDYAKYIKSVTLPVPRLDRYEQGRTKTARIPHRPVAKAPVKNRRLLNLSKGRNKMTIADHHLPRLKL